MKLCSMLMNGLVWEARLSSLSPDSPAMKALLILDNEEVLSPEDAAFGEFSIVEATAAERKALSQAGYSLPDWTTDHRPE